MFQPAFTQFTQFTQSVISVHQLFLILTLKIIWSVSTLGIIVFIENEYCCIIDMSNF